MHVSGSHRQPHNLQQPAPPGRGPETRARKRLKHWHMAPRNTPLYLLPADLWGHLFDLLFSTDMPVCILQNQHVCHDCSWSVNISYFLVHDFTCSTCLSSVIWTKLSDFFLKGTWLDSCLISYLIKYTKLNDRKRCFCRGFAIRTTYSLLRKYKPGLEAERCRDLHIIFSVLLKSAVSNEGKRPELQRLGQEQGTSLC